MSASLPSFSCDVFVAGCGMAGLAASLFAARAGLNVVQTGGTAEIVFASGLFDVYGASDPWKAMAALGGLSKAAGKSPSQNTFDTVRHPYSRLQPCAVRRAMDEFLAWLGDHGLPYRHGEGSCQVLTPMGAFKRTWAVPESMWAGVEAVRQKAPVLLVDFAGLREYSAMQIAQVAGRHWPGLVAARLDFPAPVPQPLLPGAMAQALELPEHRAALANAIAPLLHQHPHIRYVALPAILGMARSGEVLADMRARLSGIRAAMMPETGTGAPRKQGAEDFHAEDKTGSEHGVEVFEVPTLPASVPGMRLKYLFESHLDKEGVTPRRMTRALSVKAQGKGFSVLLGGPEAEEEILARHVVLATGRFMGRGLRAERHVIHECLMDLPVAQPESRELWHSEDLFDPAGHAVNRAGLMVDDAFRPVDGQGRLVHPHLHAVGAILAGQDWVREKCGVGLAVATARAAVDHIIAQG